MLSSSVHSRSLRCLADLPWGTRPVCLQLTVRTFVCRNPRCRRRIFTEWLPELVAVDARKTQRLVAALQAIGIVLGGQAGARLTQRLGLPTSRDTLLRLVRRLPPPVISPLRAIGVDDWAHRKRRRYGAIVVDLEQRQLPHGGALCAAAASGTRVAAARAAPGPHTPGSRGGTAQTP
jgi:transposase